ncbi:NRDE family protein [Algoriphagus confluentis]|uniref:NRDE family protein n=1 Tax=Algoriphagus confluentis TaxID=1697556 RepID=A0ABQ6PJF8_9BACT|nr:NRDE family protein [Algoriphagus confluentis]
MCLVAIAWKVHPNFPLLISANRDEFFDRPTSSLHQWEEGWYAGKDLRGGGTWMGFHPNGKWALLTNYRDFPQKNEARISRGKLVTDFLHSPLSPENYLDQVWEKRELFDGFNLLTAEGDRLYYVSNYGKGPQEILPGIHGLSNGLINDPWPKTELAKKQLMAVLPDPNPEILLDILKSEEKYPWELLPETGVPKEMEESLSAQLIRMPPNYGTVSATAVLRDPKGYTQLKERRFAWDLHQFSETMVQF